MPIIAQRRSGLPVVVAKSEQPGSHPAWADFGATEPANGKAIPIAYGTVKITATMVDQGAPKVGWPKQWQPNFAYSVGAIVVNRFTDGGNSYRMAVSFGDGLSGGPSAAPDGNGSPAVPWQGNYTYDMGQVVTSNGNLYVAIVGGSTMIFGPAPSGVGESIADGSVVWKYIGAGTSASYVRDNHLLWEYIQSGPVPLWSSAFAAALCEGPISTVLATWWDQERGAGNAGKDIAWALGDGVNAALPIELWPAPWHYVDTALIASATSAGTATGTAKDLPGTIAAEVKAIGPFDANGDVNAADVVTDILTHTRRGVGWSSSRIADLTPYRTYLDAAGLHLSLLVDAQRTVLDILGSILLATNSDAVWSQGQLKIVPRGDTAISAPVFGSATYTPNNAAVYALGPDDFLAPIQIQRLSEADSYNDCPVTYVSRADDYSEQTVSDPDVADIQRRQLAGAPNSGKNSAGATSLGLVVAPESATMLSRLWAQRNTQSRNTYTIKVGWRYMLLEPTDVVTITDPVMGVSALPVRILAVEESIGSQGEGELTITAEDWPAGVATAARWTPQVGDGYAPNQASTAASIAPVTLGDVQAVGAAAATKISAYVAASAPTGGTYTAGDLWFDTGNGNKPNTWNGSAWVSVQDAAIAAARAAADAASLAASGASTLAGSKTRVFYRTTAPANPADDLHAGDVWFNNSTYVDTDGRTKTKFAPSTWDGSAWAAVTGADTLVVPEVAAGAVTAASIAAGQLKTTNYAEDGSGYPTAGAKLDHTGTALKVAPGSLQTGMMGVAYCNSSGSIYKQTGFGAFTNGIGAFSDDTTTMGDGRSRLKVSFGVTLGTDTDPKPYMVQVMPYSGGSTIIFGQYRYQCVYRKSTYCLIECRQSTGGIIDFNQMTSATWLVAILSLW